MQFGRCIVVTASKSLRSHSMLLLYKKCYDDGRTVEQGLILSECRSPAGSNRNLTKREEKDSSRQT